MRKIEIEMMNAVRRRVPFHHGNTVVEVTDAELGSGKADVVRVLLHGNCIAAINHAAGTLTLRACGWLSATTFSRMHVLLSELMPGARASYSKVRSSWTVTVPRRSVSSGEVGFDTHTMTSRGFVILALRSGLQAVGQAEEQAQDAGQGATP